jgi:SNF2 family DNA or RNA helicase
LDCDPTDAGYDYLLKLARVRFLLADDAGAGKTIMAGLLVRELKLRGLVERVLVLCPANLTFQWQRELKEKFDEKFIVLNPYSFRSRHQTVGQQGAALSAGRRPPLALPLQGDRGRVLGESDEFRKLHRAIEKAQGDRDRALRNVCRLYGVKTLDALSGAIRPATLALLGPK